MYGSSKTVTDLFELREYLDRLIAEAECQDQPSYTVLFDEPLRVAIYEKALIDGSTVFNMRFENLTE